MPVKQYVVSLYYKIKEIMTTQTSPNMSKGHIAQIIRRMTVQKSVQSKKVYKRNKMRKVDF